MRWLGRSGRNLSLRGAGALCFAAIFGSCLGHAQTIKVLTMNIWSGLDYKGTFCMGEVEPDSVRHQRLELLADELREADPDLVALQECNPVADIGSFLASRLGYDYLAQRANGGLKVGCLGIPSNLNEGLVLLAKKKLHLREVDVLDLSRTFGAFGNIVSIHSSDQNIALAGVVTLDRRDVFVVNTHLTANIPFDSSAHARLDTLLSRRNIGEERRRVLQREFADRGTLRAVEIRRLIDSYETRWSGMPVLVLGDFNAPPAAPELGLMDKDFFDAAAVRGLDAPTWDPSVNTNVLSSRTPRDSADIGEVMSAWYDGIPRRIDYIFLNRLFLPEDVHDVVLFGSVPRKGIFISDHYGIASTIALDRVFAGMPGQSDDIILRPRKKLDVLPILTYDTDVGFGYGAKAFFLNYLGSSESFDAVAFNSTKGERWYRLVFSVPDFELRQGKSYPFSLDLILDYDRYLKNNFFGVGKGARASERETYTKEPLEIQFVGSRGFSDQVVGQLGIRFKTVRNIPADSAGAFVKDLPSINQGRSQALTLFASFRFDSRNSFVNPSNGNVIQLDGEAGGSGVLSDYNIAFLGLSLQTYHILFYPKTVVAGRMVVRSVSGSGLPIHAYASLGGTGTLRGFPQDRFLDKAMLLTNVEIRCPIFWRFGGVLFYDAGTVASSLGRLNLAGWSTNPGAGLRFIMDTFVVRADLGFSREGTGFYFNFGNLF